MKLSRGEHIAIIVTVLFITAAGVAAAMGSLSGGHSAVSLSSVSASPSGTDASGAAGTLININTADAAALDTLPGIGEKTAAAIVDYRNEHGFFADISELMDVPGIGSSTFEGLRLLIIV